MDVFDSRYYRINKFISSVTGLWVFQTIGNKRIARMIVFLSVSTTVIPQFNYLFLVRGNIDEMLDCITPLMVVLVSICQLSVFLFNEKKLINIVNCIERDWNFWSSRKEFEILMVNAESGRFLTILYAVNVYSCVATFVSMSLTPVFLDIIIPLNETRPKLLVYPVQFPFNQDEHFYLLFVHGSLTSFYNVSIILSCESMLAVSTQHVCAILKIISHRLKNVIKLMEENKKTDGLCTEDQIYKEISLSIEWHNKALELANSLDTFFSPLLFFTASMIVIGMSFLAIQTINSIGSLFKFIKFATFTFGLILHLYCLTLPAQNLINRSNEVANNAYEASWYQIPNRSKKLLILIIQRGQKPCKLTAAKICVFDMMTFSGLLKTSVSYFMVLSSLQ